LFCDLLFLLPKKKKRKEKKRKTNDRERKREPPKVEGKKIKQKNGRF